MRSPEEAARFMVKRYGSKAKALLAASDHAMTYRQDDRRNDRLFVEGEQYWLTVYRLIREQK